MIASLALPLISQPKLRAVELQVIALEVWDRLITIEL
jgi:hypothetical protein